MHLNYGSDWSLNNPDVDRLMIMIIWSVKSPSFDPCLGVDLVGGNVASPAIAGGVGAVGATPIRGKRGRPRKHAIKIPLPPLYVFIRNMLHNDSYNPRVIGWVSEAQGVFKVTNTVDFAQTWGRMKSNRSEEMNYEKVRSSPDRLCTMIVDSIV